MALDLTPDPENVRCERKESSERAKKWPRCGLFCATLSALLHVNGIIGLFFFLSSDKQQQNNNNNNNKWNFLTELFVIVYGPIFLLAEWSLFMTWWTDPGAVPLGARPPRQRK